MKKGDIVLHRKISWDVPGVIVKKPYGAVIKKPPNLTLETMVVDVLVGIKVFYKVDTSDLYIIF